MFKKNEIDMLNGPISSRLFIFALPIALSGMVQQLFNSADIAVVGRFAGSECLAAVGANSFVINLLVNLFIGLSIGSNVLIAACIGRKDEESASKAVHSSIIISLICGFIILFIGEIFARDILILMNTPDDILDLAVLYLRVYFGGMPFIMLYNFESAILRSKGDTTRPLIILLISGSINVLLNLFFVIVLGMTVDGVALATVISNAISAIVIFYLLLHEKGPFKVSFSKLRIDLPSLKPIVAVGMPAGLQGCMFSLSNVIIQVAMNSLGTMAVAANTTGINFEYFGFFILNSFSQAAVSFLSQNYAAKNYERCRKIIKRSVILVVVSMVIVMTICLIFATQISSLFTDDPAVIALAVRRVSVVLPFQVLNGINEVLGGCMRGLGHSLTPAIVCMLGVCALRVAWILFVFPLKPLFDTLILIYPITWVTTMVCMIAAFYFIYKKTPGLSKTN